MTTPVLRSVSVRLLPWRPRFHDVPSMDATDALSFGDFDDGLVAGLVIGVVVALLLPFVLVLLLFSLELALLVLLLPLVMAGQLLRLLPWVLVLRYDDGSRRTHEVRGTLAMLAARRVLRTRIGTSVLT